MEEEGAISKAKSIPLVGKQRHLRAKLLQSCANLGHPMDCSPPGSSVHGILQARILGWVARPSSRRSYKPSSLMSPALAGGFFITSTPWKSLLKVMITKR